MKRNRRETAESLAIYASSCRKTLQNRLSILAREFGCAGMTGMAQSVCPACPKRPF